VTFINQPNVKRFLQFCKYDKAAWHALLHIHLFMKDSRLDFYQAVDYLCRAYDSFGAGVPVVMELAELFVEDTTSDTDDEADRADKESDFPL